MYNNFPDAISLDFFWVELPRYHKWSTVEYSIFKTETATPYNKKKVIEIPQSEALSQMALVTQALCFLFLFIPSDMISPINQ